MSHVISDMEKPLVLNWHTMVQTAAGLIKPDPAPLGDAGYPNASMWGGKASEYDWPVEADAEYPAKSACAYCSANVMVYAQFCARTFV